jgi:hypothetical protein
MSWVLRQLLGLVSAEKVVFNLENYYDLDSMNGSGRDT